MQLNLLEKRMSNIRLVPKVVLLMVFSTLMLLTKLWFDAKQKKRATQRVTRFNLVHRQANRS